MSFKVTFEPSNRIVGVGSTTAEFESARDAWLEVHGLMASDERVTITENGRPIGWQELRDKAKGEAN